MLRDRIISALYEVDNGNLPDSLESARAIYGSRADSVLAVISESQPDLVLGLLTAMVIRTGLGVAEFSASELQRASHWDLDVEAQEFGMRVRVLPYKGGASSGFGVGSA